MSKVFILAMNRSFAGDLANRHGYKHCNYEILESHMQLRGLRNPVVICGSAWGRRWNREDMRNELQRCGAILVSPYHQEIRFTSDVDPSTLKGGD